MSAPSAAEPVTGGATRTFTYRMDKPVAPYLIAIAAGDIAFRELGQKRSNDVFAGAEEHEILSVDVGARLRARRCFDGRVHLLGGTDRTRRKAQQETRATNSRMIPSVARRPYRQRRRSRG